MAIGDVVFGSSGSRIGTVGIPTVKSQAMWADDSRHLCGLLDPSGSVVAGTREVLEYLTPGAPPRPVTNVGAVGGQQGSSLVACSAASDRAIVEHAVIDHLDEVLVIRLSTGEVLATHQYGQPPSCAPSTPVCGAAVEVNSLAASPDGHLVAENYLDGHSVLRDLAGWRSPGPPPHHGHTVLVGREPRHDRGGNCRPAFGNGARTGDWATLLGPVLASSFVARPGQSDVMVPGLGGTLALVRRDGTVQRLNGPIGTLLGQ